MNKDIRPVLNALANLAIALESFVTVLVKHSGEMPDLLVSEPDVQALLKRERQASDHASDAEKERQLTASAETNSVEPAVTIEQVRKALAEKSQNGKQPEVKALISSYGVRRLTEIDPTHYAEILQRTGGL